MSNPGPATAGINSDDPASEVFLYRILDGVPIEDAASGPLFETKRSQKKISPFFLFFLFPIPPSSPSFQFSSSIPPGSLPNPTEYDMILSSLFSDLKRIISVSDG
jgi:hypothetical protein